jgi:hypothetical protein
LSEFANHKTESLNILLYLCFEFGIFFDKLVPVIGNLSDEVIQGLTDEVSNADEQGYRTPQHNRVCQKIGTAARLQPAKRYEKDDGNEKSKKHGTDEYAGKFDSSQNDNRCSRDNESL